MPISKAPHEPIAIAFSGSGGSGAVTAGSILLAAAARAGHYGLMMRSAGPQIRGGESAALVRFGPRPIGCIGDRFDLLVGLDWGNHGRFRDEIPLGADSLILADPAAGPVPEPIVAEGVEIRQVPFLDLAGSVADGHMNMVGVGAAGALAGLPLDALVAAAGTALAGKGEAVVSAAQACIRLGHQIQDDAPPSRVGHGCGRWDLSGNEAAGLGALRGGVRFVAAYPITPASEMLEWLAPRLERLGGALLQAEDELASINMIIGSSFGGVPSLTATSGPGLSLMMEGVGLAIASETPVVVVNVQRGGPSTGIPTKSEQADLDLALYGCHGDAPHLVLAALGIADCVLTTAWAVRLAEHLQTAAIVLSDQAIGQSRAIIDPSPPFESPLRRIIPNGPEPDYQRYALTASGISPMRIPGCPGPSYTADGLEHDAAATPSSLAADHHCQLAKRHDKLARFDYGAHWAEIDGGGPGDAGSDAVGPSLCLICWGSAHGAVGEAAERLRDRGLAVKVVALRLIAPLQRDALRAAIGAALPLVIEQNASGQLFGWLRAEGALDGDAQSIARPGPLPLRPGEIVADVLAKTQL
jgi:2-oxoglutarate ferredoxin oxidoreductase subunit alpha